MRATAAPARPVLQRAAVRAPALPTGVIAPEDEAMWREFRRTRSIELRNRLVLRYMDLARVAADRERSRLPAEVDPEDLRQAATIALMRAIEKFNPDRGAKFETFCSLRLRGGIMDELRHMDWVPRLVRNRAAQLERQRSRVEAEIGRTATDEEIRRHVGARPEEWRKVRRDGMPPSMVSLDRPCYDGDSQRVVREIDVVGDDRAVAPETHALRSDMLARLGRGLTRSEKLVIVLYYYEHLTMRAIGEVLDLSESRVSQMHTSIIRRLRAAAKGLAEDLGA